MNCKRCGHSFDDHIVEDMLLCGRSNFSWRLRRKGRPLRVPVQEVSHER